MGTAAVTQRGNAFPARRHDRTARGLCIVAVFLTASCILGCGDTEVPPRQDAPQDAGQDARADTPAQILERMFAVYRDCKTYADNAVYRERWVLREDGVVREPPPQMVSVSLERPAKVRIVRRVPDADGNVAEQVTVLSNGTRMYHTLPRFPRQILETVAPLNLNSENVLSAPHVEESLLFVPLADSFAQLDLLLSAKPQETALSSGSTDASPVLLEDGLLGDRPCYRVAQSDNAGRRIYWIDKESHLLRRLDLPTGDVREAIDRYDQLQDFERWIEFLDVAVDQELPANAFELAVPEDAVVVRQWVDGHPGPASSGPNVSPEEQQLYHSRLARYEADLATASTTGPEFKVEVAVPEIAPRSEPQSFQLTEAWKAQGLSAPGDVIAVDGSPDQNERAGHIVLLDGGKVVVELGVDGQWIARHDLEVLQDAPATRVRTILSKSAGDTHQRWFAMTGPGLQRVHVFNAAWQHQWSFPEHEHQGIGDAVLAPFGEEAEPQLVVGFWGDLGVHGVSLAGTREWVDRSLQEVLGLALAMDDRGNAAVWTAHGRDVIGRVGRDGPLPPLSVPGRAIVDVAAGDLDGDGQHEYCGIAFGELGVYDAVGLDATGRELWSYRLPKGEFRTPTRRIVATTGDKLQGWILPAADGSIHVLALDGALVDRFNYGKAITGILMAAHEGEPLLLVTSPDGLATWRLKPKP